MTTRSIAQASAAAWAASFLLAACSGASSARGGDAGLTDTARVLADQLAARYHERPDSVEVLPGSLLRLVYVRPLQAPTAADAPVKYATDSARYRAAFAQAVWLWTRIGERVGIDSVSVRWVERGTSEPAGFGRTSEFRFRPDELRDPEHPPTLDPPDGRRAAPAPPR
jgi:hypothetical protein